MKTQPALLLAIAAGGALGALARFGAGRFAAALFGPHYPWGTLLVNVAGCFAMGALAALFADKEATAARGFLMIGCLGAFTSFSAFAYDAAMLAKDRSLVAASLYVGASVALSLVAFIAGAAGVRALT
jgi:CrcB protein